MVQGWSEGCRLKGRPDGLTRLEVAMVREWFLEFRRSIRMWVFDRCGDFNCPGVYLIYDDKPKRDYCSVCSGHRTDWEPKKKQPAKAGC